MAPTRRPCASCRQAVSDAHILTNAVWEPEQTPVSLEQRRDCRGHARVPTRPGAEAGYYSLLPLGRKRTMVAPLVPCDLAEQECRPKAAQPAPVPGVRT